MPMGVQSDALFGLLVFYLPNMQKMSVLEVPPEAKELQYPCPGIAHFSLSTFY
jgi:hypothetical protein